VARRLQQAAGGVSSAVLASARRREQTIELDSVQAELCSRVRHIPSGCACARPRRVPPGARIPRPGHRRARGGQVGHLLASERHQGARRGAAGSARSCQARSLCGEDEEQGGAARRRRSCTHVSDALACSLATPQVWAGSGALTGFELGSDRRLRIQPSTKAWPARAALPLPFWLCRPGRLRDDAAWLAGRRSCAPRWPTRSTRSLC